MDPRGHLEMTPIFMYRHLVSLFKECLANRTCPVVKPAEPPIWKEDEPLWGQDISHIQDVLNEFREKVENTGYMFGSGRCMAYVPNSGNFASSLAELLLGQMDPFHDELSKSIERSVIRWICNMVGYPRGSDGYLTSGGSTASVIALAAARDARNIKSADYHKQVVYCTARTHTAFDKALETVGLGMCQMREVPHDAQQRMIPEELARLMEEDEKVKKLTPFVIVATTGTTDLGSIDPMREIADIAKNHGNVWFHVDGAIGAFYALSAQMDDLFDGMESSDSMILDPHKSLSQPYGCGCVLFRNKAHKTISCHKDPELGVVPVWQNPLENRMMFRSFVIWFSVNAMGVKTFRTVLERNLELSQYVYDQLKDIPELDVMEPQLSTVAFRMKGTAEEEKQGDYEAANKRTNLLIKEMDEDERVCLSATTIDNYRYNRICICNYRDHLSELNLCLDEIYTQLEDVLGRSVDRSMKPTTAKVQWLEQVEKDLRWKEYDLAARFMDRMIRMVFNEVIHGEVEKMAYEIHGLQDNLLYISEEAVDVEKLLFITSAVAMKGIRKPKCRFACSIGHLLAVVNNNVSGIRSTAPGSVELEEKIITHMAYKFGMSGDSRGVLSSDICTANEVAFIAARQGKFARLKKPEKGGKRGRKANRRKKKTTEDDDEIVMHNEEFSKAVVYTTEAGVSKFANELTLIGLGECHKVVIKADGRGMDVEDLKNKIKEDEKDGQKIPWMVIQPVDGFWTRNDVSVVTNLCKELNVWHHVEVGPGTASRLFELHSTKEAPMPTDSVSVNIGPSLSLPIGMAATMVAKHELLHQSMTNHRKPPYLPDLDPNDIVYEPKVYSFELSRANRSTPLWFTLRLLGTKICCADVC